MNPKKKNDKKTFLILTITAYAVLAGVMIYRAQQSPGTCPLLSMCSSPATTEKTKVKNAAVPLVKKEKTEIKKVIKTKEAKLPELLELGSKSCVPCQMMEPVLAKLKKGYDGVLKVSFVDVWLKENEAVGKKYKINSIPVQIFLDAEAKELWRHKGFFSEENIVKKWKELGYDLSALKKNKK